MNLKRNHPLALALGIALAVAPLALRAQVASNDVYQALVKREFGTALDEMTAIDKQIQDAKPEEYPAIEARLIAVLEMPDATMPGKQYACQKLKLVGSKKCIPAVAKLLADEKLSHMARNIFLGMNNPAVDDALRDALGKTQGSTRTGIVNTIGDRHDQSALKLLAALLKDDEATAGAALNAIGKIGGEKAADILDDAKVPDVSKTAWAQAYLRCASGLAAQGETAKAQKMYHALLDGNGPSQVRAGAFRGIVFDQKDAAVPTIIQMLGSDDKLLKRAALAAVISVQGHVATEAFTKQLASLAPDVKATMIGALAARGDAEGLTDSVNKFASDENETVRTAALKSLGRLGNSSSVPVLVGALKDATNGVVALQSLVDLRGDGVVDDLIKQAESGDAQVRAAVLGVLGERRQIEALPVARKSLNDADSKIRDAGLKAISELGTQEDLQFLCDAILTKTNEGERDRISRAISTIGVRLADKTKRDDSVLQAFAKADAAIKVQLVPVLAAFGGDKALAVTRGVLDEKGELRKSAVRALGEWPDSAPLADLRKIAKEENDLSIRVLALRGCIKMIGPSRLKTDEKIAAFGEVMELSSRPDEKRQALSEIGKIGNVKTLKMVEPCLADDNLKREALQAYEKIAESLTGGQPAVAKEALQKVLAMTNDQGLREKAQAALEKVK